MAARETKKTGAMSEYCPGLQWDDIIEEVPTEWLWAAMRSWRRTGKPLKVVASDYTATISFEKTNHDDAAD